jgi:opacity protein-like surface antigen
VGGGGLEYAFSPIMTVKVEYLHADLGKANAGISPFLSDPMTAHLKFDLVRLGVNAKFSTQ